MRYCCMKAEAKGQDCREVTCPDSPVNTQLGMSVLQVDEIISHHKEVKDTQETSLYRPVLEGRPRPKEVQPSFLTQFLYWVILLLWFLGAIFLHQLTP